MILRGIGGSRFPLGVRPEGDLYWVAVRPAGSWAVETPKD
ncbi:hypothetical protein [Alloactinosynnema sp. L-07]|nr:hypothetical protein [Alloactinosynnema sp. L-07]